jgi:hypothetical protein
MLTLAIVSECATERKAVVKSTGEEISDIEAMITDVDDKNWNSHMERMREGIIDQLKRTEYGMKIGQITNTEGAEIIAKAQDVIDKMDDFAKNVGNNSGGHKGSGGGFGGGGWGGGGTGRHNADDGTSDDSGQRHGQPKDFLELKDMIDNYYSNTVTAAAYVPATGTTVPEPNGNK